MEQQGTTTQTTTASTSESSNCGGPTTTTVPPPAVPATVVSATIMSFSQDEYHYHFVPKNPLEIAKGLQNTTVDASTTSAAAGGIAAVAPLQLDNFFLSRPQPGDDRECIEMLTKVAGFSLTHLEAKRRKGELDREAFVKKYYRNQAFREKNKQPRSPS